jgi:hypothetical protein
MNSKTEQFRQATAALYSGEEERAAALLADASAVDVDQVALQLERRAAAKTAVDKLLRDHPELRDADFAFIADKRIDDLVRQGTPLDAAIAEAGEQLAAKYGWGQQARARLRPASATRASEDDPSAIIAEIAAARPGRML